MRNGCHAGWLLVLVPACFHPSYDHPTCGPNGECPSGLTCSAQLICEEKGTPGDGVPDSGTPGATGPQYGTFIKVGFPSLSDVPTAPLLWTNNMTINTDGSMCDTRNNQASRYCVIAGSSITLASGNTLTAHGSKPL